MLHRHGILGGIDNTISTLDAEIGEVRERERARVALVQTNEAHESAQDNWRRVGWSFKVKKSPTKRRLLTASTSLVASQH